MKIAQYKSGGHFEEHGPGKSILSVKRGKDLLWFENNISKNARIVEVGAGDGVMLDMLSDLGYTNLKGIEKNKDIIVPESKVRYGDVFTISKEYAPESVDVVMDYGLLEHFHSNEQKLALQQIHSILRRGGYACFDWPYLSMRRKIHVPKILLNNFAARLRGGVFWQDIYDEVGAKKVLEPFFNIKQFFYRASGARFVILTQKK